MLKYFLKIKSGKTYDRCKERITPNITIDKWYELSTMDGGETGTIVDDRGNNVYGYALLSGHLNSYWEVVSAEEGSQKHRYLLGSNPKKKSCPRYHKPRKRPPIRKKTDAIFHYDNNTTYTIKNVSYIFAGHGEYINVEYKENGFEKSVKVPCKDGYLYVEIKSPDMITNIYLNHLGMSGDVMFLGTGKELSWSGDYYEENF